LRLHPFLSLLQVLRSLWQPSPFISLLLEKGGGDGERVGKENSQKMPKKDQQLQGQQQPLLLRPTPPRDQRIHHCEKKVSKLDSP